MRSELCNAHYLAETSHSDQLVNIEIRFCFPLCSLEFSALVGYSLAQILPTQLKVRRIIACWLPILMEYLELVHQMRLSKTQVIFTDTESCSKILKAAEILGIEHSRIFLINNDENLHLGNGIRRLDELLHNGELQWDTLDHVDKVSERYESS